MNTSAKYPIDRSFLRIRESHYSNYVNYVIYLDARLSWSSYKSESRFFFCIFSISFSRVQALTPSSHLNPRPIPSSRTADRKQVPLLSRAEQSERVSGSPLSGPGANKVVDIVRTQTSPGN